jgi:tight adherence protein B
MDIVIAGGVFGAIFIVFLIVVTGGASSATEQAQEMLRRMSRPDEDDDDITAHRRGKPDPGKFVAVLLRHFNLVRTLEENLWQAGLYVRVSDAILVMLLMFGAGGAAGEALSGDWMIALGGGAVFASLPVVYIRFRKARRLKAFAGQLPFALDLIKSSLEAGHTLLRALQVVVGEFSDPLGSEFRTVLEQVRLGLPLTRAMEDMLKRVPEEDLRLLLVAVKVQTEVGSSLAAIVARLGEVIRTRQRLKLQIRTLTAQARMGGMVVGALPIIVLGAFYFIQPNYTHELFSDPTGLKILKMAIGLDAMAFVTIRKLVKVKY